MLVFPGQFLPCSSVVPRPIRVLRFPKEDGGSLRPARGRTMEMV